MDILKYINGLVGGAEEKNRRLRMDPVNMNDPFILEEIKKLVNTLSDYELPGPGAGALTFEKEEEFVDDSREITGIITDLIVNEFLKEADSVYNFLEVVVKTFEYAIKEYVNTNGIQPADTGVFFVYKGGNVMRLVAKVFEKVLDHKSSKVLNDFYKSYFKRSDADFSIYVDPKVRKGSNTDAFEEVFDDMTRLSYKLQVFIRRHFNKNMTEFFDFYKYSSDYKEKILREYLNKVNASYSMTDRNNETFHKTKAISLAFYDTVVSSGDRSTSCEYKSEEGKDDVGVVGTKKRDISVIPSGENGVVVYPITEKGHANYISANQALRFKSGAGKDIRFNLVRTKFNAVITFIRDDGTCFKKNFGGELIDVSSTHRESGDNDLAHFYEHIDEYIERYKYVKPSGEFFEFSSYDIKYLIFDLEYILFEFSKVPWKDVKYGKRVNRLIFLYFINLLFLDKWNDNQKNEYIGKFQNQMFNIRSKNWDQFSVSKEDVKQSIDSFRKEYESMGLESDRLLKELVRVVDEVNDKKEFENFREFIRVIDNNLAVTLEALSKRINYVHNKKAGINPPDFEKLSSQTFIGAGKRSRKRSKKRRKVYDHTFHYSDYLENGTPKCTPI